MNRVVVFGGNGSIGKAVVEILSGSNFCKVYSADIDLPAVQLNNTSYEIIDCNSFSDVKKFINDKKINRIVNCTYPRTPSYGKKLDSLENSEVLDNVKVHLQSFLNTTRAGCEIFSTKLEQGRIINISSIYGIISPDFSLYPENSGMTVPLEYCIAKGALRSISSYLLKYYNNKYVIINSVAPGGIYADQDSEFVRRYNKKTFSQRMLASHEVANLISYLIVSAPDSINGQEFIIDDGFTLR